MSILDRLRDPSDDALTSLVSLIVDDAMGRPMGDVVDAERWPRLVAEISGAWAGSDAAEERLVQAVLDGVDALDELDGALLLMCSPAGRHITGTTLAIDGGHAIAGM